jgi:squalene synthase HpnC
VAPYLETPSSKDAKYENFPVGSWLLSSKLRPHVACFYAFARSADNIADNPELSSDEKIKRLDGFEEALLGKGSGDTAYQKALDMAESLKESGVSPQHCRDLLCAFKQDAVKSRYSDWADVIAYCALSAAPVGRYMIDLHGGSNLGYWASDALCAALQLINHLQDCGDDYRTMDRVYLPMDWVSEAGLDLTDLSCDKTTLALRRVLDWTLIGINGQLRDANALPASLYSTRLSLEASVIYQIARKLSHKLGNKDPLSQRIQLSKSDLASCTLKGVAAGLICRC